MMEAVGDLARQILRDDPTGWDALVEAQLLAVDELLPTAALIEQVGRAGARVPVFETLCLGWPLRQHPEVSAETALTGGLHEPDERDPRHAETEVRDGRAYGVKTCVPAADRAQWMALAATDGVYGIRLEDAQVVVQTGTNGDPLGEVTLDGVPAIRLGGRDLMDRWLARVDVGLCALLLGLSKQALRMTARYVAERQQFGKPIGTFQAVGQRAADAWIDTQAMEVTLWSAACQVSEGQDAERALRIARYTASEGSHRVVAAAQHLHGGMGYDLDYPLARYFLTAKQWEHVLGGSGAQLEALGAWLAAS